MTDQLFEATWLLAPESVDAFSDHLFELGAFSVTTSDDLKNKTAIACTYPESVADAILQLNPTHHRQVMDNEWQNRWLDDYAGAQLCDNTITICPVPIDPGRRPSKTIWLDPNSAFGDGHHPTTQACASAIAAIASLRRVNTMADLGCGTGILSLVGGVLNIPNRYALDFDPASVSQTLKNSRINQLPIQVQQGDVLITSPPHPFDLVVANLQSAILEQLIPSLHKWCNPCHHVILSGIHQKWMPQIESILVAHQFNIHKKQTQGEWGIFTGEFEFA